MTARERRLLRLLREQWEYNHSEHCGGKWPHPEAERCHWPPPAELNSGPSPLQENARGALSSEGDGALDVRAFMEWWDHAELDELEAWARSHSALEAGRGTVDDVLGFIAWRRAVRRGDRR